MNKCDGCTACCTAFYIEWLDKPRHTRCIHCEDGCLIHETKHKECDDFECAYIQSGVDNTKLRPDNCGVIFERMGDGENHEDVFLATIIEGGVITADAKRQVAEFKHQGFEVRINR